jgi:hypothetical protein
MPSHFRVVIWSIVSLAILMLLTLGLHIGGEDVLQVALFSGLTGAVVGATLTLFSVNFRFSQEKNAEPWIGHEKLAWNLMGLGIVGWVIGESFWRYYVLQGEPPFPSLADCGYVTFAPLVFIGLTLQPFSKSGRKRVFLVLDSLIAMGALLSIAWFLLLGPLAQTPSDTLLAKFLGLYYPFSDVVLISCTLFLLLRGTDPIYQVPARRISFLVLGLGMTVYAISDFIFNVMANLGLPLEGSWFDLGWPYGLMALGVAAYVRRFLPSDGTKVQQKRRLARLNSGLSQAVPYFLLGILFIVLAINVLSTDEMQQSIRPVLIASTFIVIALLVARQVVTMRENERLMREAQKIAELEALEIKRQEEQLAVSKQIEDGIQHILATLNTVVTQNDFAMRVPLKQENILWRVGRSINNLLSRIQGFKQEQEQLKKTHVVALAVAQRIRDGQAIQLNAWTGTALDPVIMEYNKRLQDSSGRSSSAKPRVVPERPKPTSPR